MRLCENACKAVTRLTGGPSCTITVGLTGSPYWRLRKLGPVLTLPSFAPFCRANARSFVLLAPEHIAIQLAG